ncbi:hypothetical protein KO529_19175 [Arenibacter algicola]|uniref:hypothetical protein n=1 Tax=Arenibacter algicola TaxID=616991 RepID=UPI001C078BD3|nr:hypothetical protein [Arenibacter algicola]MBU2906931.1 hypothetical protein [Arenibacter algicola]
MTKTGNERDWNEKLVFLRERVYEVPSQETLHCMDQIPPTWEGARGRTLRQDNQPHQKQSRQSKTDCLTMPVYRLGILAMTLKDQVEHPDSHG